VWIPFYIAVIYQIVKLKGKEAIWLILSIICCIILADQISSGFLKDFIHRLRPSHEKSLESIIHLVKGYKGGNYGFASSHAANTFGLALISSLIFKNKIFTISVFFWAVLTAYSRIYLGVHYPGDVLGGIIVGTLSAILCYTITKKYKSELFKIKTDSLKTKFSLPSVILILSVIIIGFSSLF